MKYSYSVRVVSIAAILGVLGCVPADPEPGGGGESGSSGGSGEPGDPDDGGSTSPGMGWYTGTESSGGIDATSDGDSDADADSSDGDGDSTGGAPATGCRPAPFENTYDLPPHTWQSLTPSPALPPEGSFHERGYTSMIYSACLGDTVSWEGYIDEVDWFPTIYSNALYTYDPLPNVVTLLKRNNWSRQGDTIPLPQNADDPTPADRHPYGAFTDAPQWGGFFVWGGANQSLAGGHPTDTWRFDAETSAWQQVDADAPAPPVMLEAAMAYHAADDQLVLHGNPMGGEGRTFVNALDGAGWIELGGSGPGTRSGTRMLYDRERERVVLFGGGAFATGGNALWSYTAASGWTDLTPAASPPYRKRHGFVHDTEHDVYVAFGGNNAGAGQVLADTWIFDPEAEVWVQVFPEDSPPATGHVDMAYDASTRLVVARLNESWWVYRSGELP